MSPATLQVEIDAVEAARKQIIEQFFDPNDLPEDESQAQPTGRGTS